MRRTIHVLTAGLLGCAFCAALAGAQPSDTYPHANEISQLLRQYGAELENKVFNGFSLKAVARSLPELDFEAVNAEELVAWIEKEFEHSPPAVSEKRDRLFAGLDLAALASANDEFAPLQEHRKRTTQKVCRILDETRPADGLTIYKLYNEGTIIRTPDVCIGIDIILHHDNDHLSASLARHLDGFFVSHPHRDHYDTVNSLIPELKKEGKPVVLVEDSDQVAIGSVLQSGKIGGLTWRAFQGMHVRTTPPSSFFVFELGGWKIVHSGDNTRWMRFASSEYARDIDIFLLKPESLYLHQTTLKGPGDIQAAMEESLAALRPRLVIPHHLMELGHQLGAYSHKTGIRVSSQVPDGTRVQMLHWGESLKYEPPFQRQQ